MKPYESHIKPGSEVAVFTFASRTNEGQPGPSYGFMYTLLHVQKHIPASIDVHYVVAHRNDWYLGGVRGMGESIDDSAAALAALAAPYRESLFLGNSMGGYAALTFGWRAGCTRAISFAPQTRFDAAFCDAIGEDRWTADREAMRRDHRIEDFAFTAQAEKGRAPRRGAIVYVGADSPTDLAYARDAEQVRRVKVKTVTGAGHDLAHELRNDGRLLQILVHEIRTAVEGPQAP